MNDKQATNDRHEKVKTDLLSHVQQIQDTQPKIIFDMKMRKS